VIRYALYFIASADGVCQAYQNCMQNSEVVTQNINLDHSFNFPWLRPTSNFYVLYIAVAVVNFSYFWSLIIGS